MCVVNGMNKKFIKNSLIIVYLGSVLALPKVLFSAEPAPCPKLTDKMYLAVAIGYDSYRMKNNIHYVDEDVNFQFSLDPSVNLPGMVGDFVLGYGRYFEKIHNAYLGLEFHVNGSAADTNSQINFPDSTFTIDTDIIVNGAYGISLLPGIKINSISMIYLKFGYNWSMISIEETVRDDGWTSTEYDDSVTTGGWSAGMGLESAFNEHFSIRTELTYTKYESFYTDIGTEINPADTQFILALVYHFV